MGPDDEHESCEEVFGWSNRCKRTVFEKLFELQGSISLREDLFCERGTMKPLALLLLIWDDK